MKILGISAHYHDSAAALVIDGEIVGAAQEERFTRVKHDNRFPAKAIDSILKSAGLSAEQIDRIVYYESLEKKFDRFVTSAIRFWPAGFANYNDALSNWLENRFKTKEEIVEYFRKKAPAVDWNNRILFSEHHLSHAASAFYPSPFKEAAIITVDGVGEWTTAGIFAGKENEITPLCETQYPHSLGLLYSAFTQYLGFKVNSGEYKVMGLAPYGKPIFADLIKKHLIQINEDGSFKLNLKYFDFHVAPSMINDEFHALFNLPPRISESPLEQIHMDLAASIQKVTEEVMLKMARFARQETGLANLCLAGGVALNCVVNGLINREGIFKNIWIQPAAGDAGCALGAALLGAKKNGELNRTHINKNTDAMKGSFLGPNFSDHQVQEILTNLGAKFTVHESEEAFLAQTAQLLSDDKVVGWFQGAMEFGPRALGGRSILGNAMSPQMQSVMNLKIKFRESFRPFAPAVLEEDCTKYFCLDAPSPYMLLVDQVQKNICTSEQDFAGLTIQERINKQRSIIPAVTHVDYSARVQTVNERQNQKFYRLLKTFKKLTGCSVLINTSFNVRGEPIVGSCEDAYRCFMGTQMDALAIGNCLLLKSGQPEIFKKEYHKEFALD